MINEEFFKIMVLLLLVVLGIALGNLKDQLNRIENKSKEDE